MPGVIARQSALKGGESMKTKDYGKAGQPSRLLVQDGQQDSRGRGGSVINGLHTSSFVRARRPLTGMQVSIKHWEGAAG